VVAREKYEVKGQNAVVRLKNGALTSFPLAYIDLAATEKINAMKLGDAVALEGLDGEPVVRATATPTPSVAALGRLRQAVAAAEGEAALPTPTTGHHPAGRWLQRQPRRPGVPGGARALSALPLPDQPGHQAGVPVHRGPGVGQAEVYKSLEAIATTYHLLAQSAPDRAPAQVEIQMLNEARKEAGLFRIASPTPPNSPPQGQRRGLLPQARHLLIRGVRRAPWRGARLQTPRAPTLARQSLGSLVLTGVHRGQLRCPRLADPRGPPRSPRQSLGSLVV